MYLALVVSRDHVHFVVFAAAALIVAATMQGAPAKSLAALTALRCKIFGNAYNPNNVRSGAKYLRQPLVGAAMLRYYPPHVNLRSIRAAVPSVGQLMFPEEAQRVMDVERKKMLGKGPPKKGEGRRAVMKGKKK